MSTIAALASTLGVLAGGAGRAQQQPATAPAASIPLGHEAFAGQWTYNADDSVNAATGKPEMSADQRRASGLGRSSATPVGRGADPGSTGAPTGGAGGTMTGVGTDPTGGVGPGGVGPGGIGPGGLGAGGAGGGDDRWGFSTGGAGSALAAAEIRRTERDLLEIARRWTITVTPDAVTFKDDLDRERTYPTDGKKQKYLLSAVEFEAKTHWDGPRLVKEIEGAYGFRMTETYTLSSDGTRLFAIIRVLGKKKDAPVVGANRVYDRVR